MSIAQNPVNGSIGGSGTQESIMRSLAPGAPACPAARIDWLANFLEISIPDECGSVEATLVSVLEGDPDPIVRHEAAFIIAELHAGGVIGGQLARPALCRAARSDSSVVARHEAIESLWCFAGRDVESTLEMLADEDDPDIAATANIALRWQRQESKE